jgi:hypothetical protein
MRWWTLLLPLGFHLWYFKRYVGGCPRYEQGVGHFKEERIRPGWILSQQLTDEWENEDEDIR